MWVESVEGEGATFFFSLSAGIITSGITSQKQVRNENRTYDFTNRNILIAEDVKENFELISMMLRGTNANLLYAPDGKMALEACLNDHMIDLVLMDIRMPVMNGIEATKEIRKYRTDLPVVALTAYAFMEDRMRCMEAGCTDFLTKPVDKANLLEMIHAHLA
jgi:CheY-like chemotaxis protein